MGGPTVADREILNIQAVQCPPSMDLEGLGYTLLSGKAALNLRNYYQIWYDREGPENPYPLQLSCHDIQLSCIATCPVNLT